MSRAGGIKVVSAHDHSGYGTAARRVLLGLRDAGVPFTWTPMVTGDGWDLWYEPYLGTSIGDPDLDPFCNRRIDYDTVFVQLVPEYLLRWRLLEPDKRLVAGTVWETDRIPHHWRFFLEQADLVLVPCEWNRRVFEQASLRVPVAVFPHLAPRMTAESSSTNGVSRSAPRLPSSWRVSDGDFVFYAIEAWNARKALDDLIRCYLQTFTGADPVTLVLKTTPFDLSRRRAFGGFRGTRGIVRRLRRRHAKPARVVLITEKVTDAEIERLHARGDCYVSLTHAEGFGLGIFDAALHGKPVIATAYGAPPEYLPAGAAWLVNARPVPVEYDFGKPSFLRDQRWAQADLVQAGTLLRAAFEDRDEAARRGAQLRESLRSRYDEHALIPRLLDLLRAPA